MTTPVTPLRPGGATLPAETTSFVGRTEEIAAARELLGRARLVTLTGPGGVGKTRLAVRVAGELPRAQFDDVRMVELSALDNPGLLPNTIAAALGLPEQSARPPLDVLVEYLAERNLLLILDTCEHLLDACAKVVDVLLRGASRLRVLATSRQSLDVPGEHTVIVAPLDPASDAVRLLVERAGAVVSGFALTEANRETITSLCTRLDGIPLAIELAVVRLRAMPLQQLAARLEDRFRLLTSGRRTALERHQTLRSAIGWSYDLCSDQEKLLWARLSVFAGDFDMEAAEQVCADEALPGIEIMDVLLGLVDKSVVQWAEHGSGTRYRLLDTLREFGRERLGDEETACLDRHWNYFREQVDAFGNGFLGSEQEARYWRLRQDMANLRVALDYCFARKETTTQGLELAVRMWPYWICSGAFTEGRFWIDRGLETLAGHNELRSIGLRLTAWFGAVQGERGWPLERAAEALAIARDLDSERLQAWAIHYLAGIQMLHGDPLAAGSFATALEMYRSLGEQAGLVHAHYQSGFMHALLGDTGRGIELCDVTLELLAGTEERWAKAWAHYVKAVCYWRDGDRRQAAEMASEALWMKYAMRDVVGVAHCLEVLAWVAAAEHRAERVAWMLGAASCQWQLIGTPLFGDEVMLAYQAQAGQVAIAAIGEAGYERQFLAGARLEMADAVRYVLEDVDGLPEAVVAVAGSAEGGLSLLTAREREVAALVAQGMSNREIAERLVISKRTTDSHLEHILTKLAFTSRAQITALIAREAES